VASAGYLWNNCAINFNGRAVVNFNTQALTTGRQIIQVFYMIDSKGYRPNVGIILCNDEGRVFWAKRKGANSWQFPQGGIDGDEDPETAMYRELWEETGLCAEHVQLLGRTRYWLRYKLPDRYIRKNSTPLCIGQKQIWFILRLATDESMVRFDCGHKQEFDNWKWVEYWYPLKDVVYFKRRVYRKAMDELGALLVSNDLGINTESYLSGRLAVG
jgi:putative (di)nucleoside polyphosphate hydrolase